MGKNPATEVANAVADLEKKDPAEIATIYGCVDGALDHLFSDLPAPEAQMAVTFSYEGYHITVEQDGNATFVNTG